MDRLSELVTFISKYKRSKIKIVGDSNDTLISKLYNGISDNHFTEDDFAAKSLGYESANNPSYKKLKYLLEQRLINSAFFIDLASPRFNDQQRATVSCYKNLAAFHILAARGINKAAYNLAEKTIRIALKFELTLIVFNLSAFLYKHYSSVGNNKKKAKHYKEVHHNSEQLLRVETLANNYFSEILGELSGKRGGLNDKRLVEKLKKYHSHIVEESKGLHSKILYYHISQIHILQFEIILDYKSVIKVCEESIEFFRPLGYKRGLRRVNIQLMIANIYLNRFEQAFKQSKIAFGFIPSGVMTWFITKELYLFLCFRSKKYALAVETYKEVLSHKKFKIQSKTIKEPWKIHEAYLHYFIEIGLINPEESKQLKKFRLGKFLNEVPHYSKDKMGLNVQILIVQVLFLLLKGDIDKVTDRIAALNQYCHKHLRKDHTLRSNCFIKILVVMITSQFHKEATIRKAARYLKVLKENPIESAKQSIGIEIVPFENLWALISADLTNKFTYTPARKKRIAKLFPNFRH